MRAGVFSALVGAAAASYEKFAPHPCGEYKHDPCEEFKGCDKHHNGHYLPEKSSIFFPGHEEHKGRHFDLCREQECREEDIFVKVDFEFFEEDIVFDFFRREEREEFLFEEVEIFLNVGEASFDDHHHYGSHHGQCKYDDDEHYRCHLPYEHLVNGGYQGLCPHENRDAYIFYVKIRTVIKIKEERVELFNRGYNNHHHGGHHYPRSYYAKENDFQRQQQLANQEHFAIGYACNECKSEQYHKECKAYQHQNHNQHYNDKQQCYEKEQYCPEKPHCPCYQKPHPHPHPTMHPHPHPPMHHQPHPCPQPHHDDGKWHPGKYEPVQHHKPEFCGHCPSHKCYQKPHHPHYARSYGSQEDFECEGAFVKAYGDGERSHHFKELRPHGYEDTCIDDGYYHRYPKSDLEVAVKGPITYDGYEFGYFAIALEKRDDVALLAVKVKVEDVDYFVAEIAVFVECDGGCNEGYDQCDRENPSVCKPESYPHRHHDEQGIDEFKFEFLDEFRCEGDYFIAIYVLLCIKEGDDDCHYRKEFL